MSHWSRLTVYDCLALENALLHEELTAVESEIATLKVGKHTPSVQTPISTDISTLGRPDGEGSSSVVPEPTEDGRWGRDEFDTAREAEGIEEKDARMIKLYTDKVLYVDCRLPETAKMQSHKEESTATIGTVNSTAESSEFIENTASAEEGAIFLEEISEDVANKVSAKVSESLRLLPSIPSGSKKTGIQRSATDASVPSAHFAPSLSPEPGPIESVSAGEMNEGWYVSKLRKRPLPEPVAGESQLPHTTEKSSESEPSGKRVRRKSSSTCTSSTIDVPSQGIRTQTPVAMTTTDTIPTSHLGVDMESIYRPRIRLINRKISHVWKESDGTYKRYFGYIKCLNPDGKCIVVYDDKDEYLLTLHELFEDYQSGDLKFV